MVEIGLYGVACFATQRSATPNWFMYTPGVLLYDFLSGVVRRHLRSLCFIFILLELIGSYMTVVGV